MPYTSAERLEQLQFTAEDEDEEDEAAQAMEFFGMASGPVPYGEFKKRLSERDE
jgi:hypothetical protein